MSFIKKFKGFITKYLFNTKWRCLSCGREIFDGGYFCDDCKLKLPLNDGNICDRCGRKTIQSQTACTTCKQGIQNFNKARSSFEYQKPIKQLIQKLKFYNKRFYAEVFADYLAITYFKNMFAPDVITYVPMTEKAKRKRGYNQSEMLAKELSKRVNVQVVDCLVKIKETKRQAKLNKAQRMKNLQGAFKVVDKKLVKGKRVLLVDDVLTTGTTVNAVSEKLLKAGATCVDVLTVASVTNKEGY